MKTSKSRPLIALLALALFVCIGQLMLPQHVQAQDADTAVAAEVEAAAPAEKDGKSILDMFKAGGWAMYPLGTLSIFGFGLIVYNFMAVKPGPILQPEVAGKLEAALKDVEIETAKNLCAETTAPLTNIVAAGLSRVDVDNYNPEQVKEAVEEASAEELAGPFVLINYLSVVGSLSPMVGLLGTVSGMVKAFNVIEAEGAGSAQALAGNISEALITTATGMIVGIPTMFFFFFFKNRYGKITSRVGRVVGDLQFTLHTALRKR